MAMETMIIAKHILNVPFQCPALLEVGYVKPMPFIRSSACKVGTVPTFLTKKLRHK